MARRLESFLDTRGVAVWLSSAWEWEKVKAQLNGTGLILSVGGDGTILRAAQAAVSVGAPITGINLGKLGFMTELSVGEVTEKIAGFAGRRRLD